MSHNKDSDISKKAKKKSDDTMKDFVDSLMSDVPMAVKLKLNKLEEELKLILKYDPVAISDNIVLSHRNIMKSYSKSELLEIIEQCDQLKIRENPAFYCAIAKEIESRS